MADLSLQSMWEEAHPNVTSWYDNFAARDAFARTYYRGTRLMAFLIRPVNVF